MHEHLLAPVGCTLSVLVLIAALVMLRRKGFPGLEHGGAAVGGGVMRWVWLGLLLLATTACGSAVERATVSPAPLISIHLASHDERPGYVPVEFEGAPLFQAAEAVVSDPDIAAARVARVEDGVIVSIDLTPAGAERLRQATAANIGRPTVLWFDGEIVMVEIIRGELGGCCVQIAMPADSEARKTGIEERVRARWPVERTGADGGGDPGWT